MDQETAGFPATIVAAVRRAAQKWPPARPDAVPGDGPAGRHG